MSRDDWKALKKRHGLNNEKIAAMFGGKYKNERAFTCSTAYRSMVEGLVKFYEATHSEDANKNAGSER